MGSILGLGSNLFNFVGNASTSSESLNKILKKLDSILKESENDIKKGRSSVSEIIDKTRLLMHEISEGGITDNLVMNLRSLQKLLNILCKEAPETCQDFRSSVLGICQSFESLTKKIQSIIHITVISFIILICFFGSFAVDYHFSCLEAGVEGIYGDDSRYLLFLRYFTVIVNISFTLVPSVLCLLIIMYLILRALGISLNDFYPIWKLVKDLMTFLAFLIIISCFKELVLQRFLGFRLSNFFSSVLISFILVFPRTKQFLEFGQNHKQEQKIKTINCEESRDISGTLPRETTRIDGDGRNQQGIRKRQDAEEEEDHDESSSGFDPEEYLQDDI